jgi:NADPH:quinone reductase
MKAIRVRQTGGPEVLRLEEVPDPVPGAGQVVIRVEAVGVNFIEIYQRTGLYAVPLPATPGSECAGVVAALGPGVEGVAVGDRVATVNAHGAYAEQTLVAADRVVKLPEGVDTRLAAAVLLQGMTAHYLTRSTYSLKAGERCLVHAAAGGVGLLLLQIASLRGAPSIGTVSTHAKAQVAREAGAEDVILYTEQDFEAEVRRITKGNGVAVVYDSVGRTTFEKSLRCLAPRGMMALFGGSSGPVPPFDPQILNRLGSLFLTRPTLAHYIATRTELLERAGDVLSLVGKGQLKVRIGGEFPLAGAAEAQRALESRATMGKLVLRP